MAQYRSRWTGEEIDDGIDKVRKIAYISVGSNPNVAINVARSSYGKVEVVASWDDNGNEYLARCTNHALIMENVPGVGVLPYESFSFECWNSGELKTVTLSNGYNFDYDPVTGDVIGYTEYNTWSNVNTVIDVDTISFTDDNYHIPSSRLVKSAIDKVAVRPNLLDNWYFVGGGSQQGAGIFPINERGATSYSGQVFGMNRWIGVLATASVSIQSGGIVVVGGVYQNLDVGTTLSLLGKTVTLTVLMLDGTLDSQTVTLPATAPSSYTLEIDTNNMRLAFNDADTIRVQMKSGSFVAMKLELGNTQTLAHKVGNAWVLNELPDYEEQLIRCRSNTADPLDSYANDTVAFKSALPAFVGATVTDMQSLENGVITEYTIPEDGYYFVYAITTNTAAMCAAFIGATSSMYPYIQAALSGNATYTRATTGIVPFKKGTVIYARALTASSADGGSAAIARLT